MILRLARRALGFGTRRKLARYDAIAGQVLAREHGCRNLSDDALRTRIDELRSQVQAGQPLDTIKVEVFALAREAARRALGQHPVPVQIIGALALHDGHVIEMKTGEGKTLTATLVCGLNALTGQGVHIATPNDYLAGRDAGWMRPVYDLLGLSTGVITQEMDDECRRDAYACDITYGIASEFGFDYLRDNMKFTLAETVQRGHAFALVDEADATLIDEAGMPLALFGPLGDHSNFYQAIDAVIAGLQSSHYDIDHRRRVSLTEAGYGEIERKLKEQQLLKEQTTLHDVASISLLHHVMQSLRAHVLLVRDRDYVVENGAVTIVDGLTGRLMPGRRYDEGLHQALEAKEGCAIGEETRTLASITFQTYFRRYAKLAGMTGTAMTDENEYREIYGLDVTPIPTHRPLIRTDQSVLHATMTGKLQAILREIEDATGRGQPVLIGAPSIAQSEALAALLEANGWQQSDDSRRGENSRTFAVLNAKHHAREADIIAGAGAPGAVTIATAMAGRGTDIRLGGDHADEATRQRVVATGGLVVIGTTHHDQERMDHQLRGRAGRQGDPGRSVFHASLEDEFLTGAAISLPSSGQATTVAAPVANRLIRAAQKRHENRNFDRRLGLLRFDAIIQRQHDTFYELRRNLRDGRDHSLAVATRLRHETIGDLIERFAPPAAPWDIAGLDRAIRSVLTLAVDIDPPSATPENDARMLAQRIRDMADRWIDGKIEAIGESQLADIMRRLMMALIDQLWSEQSERLDHLKRQIGDRRLSPHKVAAEFHLEAFELFESMMADFRHDVTAHAMRVGIHQPK
jgi:preprotein translocase subunit SecA